MTAGRIIIAEPVAEKIAAAAVLSTPGILRLEPGIGALAASLARRAARGWQADGQSPPTAGVRAEITGGTVAIEVSVAVELGRPVPEVAAAAQRNIARALTEFGGLAVGTISVLVADVDQAPPPSVPGGPDPDRRGQLR